MKQTLLYLFLSVFILSSCGGQKDSKEVAEDANEKKLDNKMEDDASFLLDAADDGMLEVMLGQLAVSKGTSETIKTLGQMMVDDHSKANEEVKALALKKNISLGAALGEENQKIYNKLSEKTGTDFDKAYAEQMVEDHKNDVDEFKEMADDAKDPDIKAFATSKVSTLEHHLQMSKSAKDQVD